MQASRHAIEALHSPDAQVSFDALAAQRRQIYARLSKRQSWWMGSHFRRWASAVATVLVLGGGLMVYEETRPQPVANETISDAQLAQEVSGMAQDSEPPSTAPLQALFEE